MAGLSGRFSGGCMTEATPSDLRAGAESMTHRRVLAVALPIVLSNATVPILGAVDTGVIGQLGQAAPIGAVGVGAVILSALYWFFGFLRMGTSGLAAQARGRGDVAETGAILMRGLILGLLGGVVFVVLQGAFVALSLKAAPASEEVETLARTYLGIRIWGAPAAIALFAINGWLIALERTRAVLVLQLWMNGLNILLDIWFVLGLGFGVEGVATATLIAEYSGLVLGLWLCRAGFAGDQWRDWARVFNRDRLRQMAAVNGDIMIRSVALNIMFIVFVFRSAAFDDVTLAANQILLQFLEITAYALDGFAFAAEALVGVSMGARQVGALRRAVILTSLWGAGAVVAMAIGFWIFGPWLIDLMTTAADVERAADGYLLWVVFAPVVGCAAWMLDGIFIGATRTRDMRKAALESLAIYGVAVLLLVPPFGNHGLWAALYVSFVARALTLAMRYTALEAAARHSD